MAFVTGLLLIYLAAALIALVVGPTPARRAAALAICGVVLAIPFAFPGASQMVRFLLSLGCLLVPLRTLDLLTAPPPGGVVQRVWHLVAIFDTRLVVRRHRRIDLDELTRCLLSAALAGATIAIWKGAETVLGGGWLFGVRLVMAATAALAGVESVTALLRLVYGALGFSLPPLHDAPHRSRSVAEFWGRRWNLVVGGWLRHYCFLPLARRGYPTAGIWAAFAASAAFHVYIVAAVLEPRWVMPTAAFFLVQPVLLALERSLGVAAWRPRSGHAWTVTVLLLVGSLFLEPLLRMVTT